MEQLPCYIYIIFGATVLLTLVIFYKATNYSRPFLLGMLAWITLQSILSVSGFYKSPTTSTTRFPLLIIPPLLFLLSRFASERGRGFLDKMDFGTLTLFHIIRIPVELVLFWLYSHQAVPEAMTFHGRNFDMLSGISAPFIYYYGFVKKKIGKWTILTWNILSLLLLLNVVSAAVFSLPARFHQFGFERPNIALGYFPFVLLPAFLVPLVILATFASIRALIRR